MWNELFFNEIQISWFDFCLNIYIFSSSSLQGICCLFSELSAYIQMGFVLKCHVLSNNRSYWVLENLVKIHWFGHKMEIPIYTNTIVNMWTTSMSQSKPSFFNFKCTPQIESSVYQKFFVEISVCFNAGFCVNEGRYWKIVVQKF